jgi:chromosome segregation ATPase
MIMADDHDDSAESTGSIESRVTTLERTVKTEARVRAQMDKDMSNLKTEFRAQRTLLQALADTQSEHTATLRDHTTMLRDHTTMLRDHGERLTRLEGGVGRLEVGQAKLEVGLSTTLAGVQTIIGLLDREIDGATELSGHPDIRE